MSSPSAAERAEPPATVESGAWAAPGRLNLIGEHTDYNDGFVLPFALPQRTTVTARRLSGPPRWRVTSAQADGEVVLTPADLSPRRVPGWAGYVAGVIWALTEAGHHVPAAELAITSDVPVGSGLSSSAALECATLSSLCDLGGLDIATERRPRLAQLAENGYVGVPCGIMDQAAAILCQHGNALLLDCRTLATEQIPFDLRRAGLALLVINTQAPHRHVENEYAARRRMCEAAAGLLGISALRDIDDLDEALAALADPIMRRRVRHVVTENARVLDAARLLRSRRVSDLGPLLTASHVSMRDDFEITVPEVDLAVEVALERGALGARMTGGGFGGCVIALVDERAVDVVRTAIDSAFRAHDYTPPTAFLAEPSAGAHRLR